MSVLLLASLCSCASTKLPNTQTASEQFSVLGGREKVIARNFYDLGSGDTVKRLWWAQRRAQETGGIAESGTGLERKYVVLPVPEHTDPDGTIKEAGTQVVEVVR